MIVRSDALRLPLRDACVDLVVTSPPYFALRSYRDGDEHYAGQIGSEESPVAFVDALIEATREMVRVLKPTGSIFVNLGDKYAGTGGGNGQSGLLGKAPIVDGADRRNHPRNNTKQTSGFVPAKSLMGLPWRYANACVDRLGLILRAELIWCLSGGARVYARTPTGDRPLMVRDLVRAYQPQNIKLWNGQKWTQVLGWNRSADTAGALEIELRSGERIGCTVGHQWPTDRGLLRADELRVGDRIETTRLPEPDKPRTPAGLSDEDVGWFVGLYIAEGSRSGRMIQIAGNPTEVERHERLARIAAAYDGQCRVYQTGEHQVTINLSGAVLHGILDRYVNGTTAASKRLSFQCWQRSDVFLTAVMAGYLSGDGHYDAKNDRWRLGFTNNDELAADMRTLAARLGATLTLKRGTATGFGQVWKIWRGEWRWDSSDHWNRRPRNEVVAISYSRARQFFDIGVADEPHIFALASGVLTHNSKPNGLPESVTDRVRRSHEQWFHLVKQGRYFSAVDEVREAQVDPHRNGHDSGSRRRLEGGANQGFGLAGEFERAYNPLGKLPGSVWTIPSEPLVIPDWARVKYNLPDHFAAFPQEWPRRIILGWSPSGVCVACGEGRRPVVEKEFHQTSVSDRKKGGPRKDLGDDGVRLVGLGAGVNGNTEATITGYACACDVPIAPTRPAVVLDPFGGTGTVAMVARALGRTGVNGDLSGDYCRLARWRIYQSGHAAKSEDRTWRDAQGAML